jgi:L-ascorbate metabolism protein UlaG (beta-lactamase superfamily)
VSRAAVLTRRRVLAGVGALAGAGVLEYTSLRGSFDHRSFPGATGAERYAASLAMLARDGDLDAGAVVHVGHSTHLISVAGVRALTDPWFYDPAFGALSHAKGPAVAPEGIGALDAVLVTHDHADHADMRAIDRLDKRAIAVVATNDLAARVRSLRLRAEVLAPWRTIAIGAARVTAVPGLHDVYEVGYVVEGAGRAVYFAGDTRLHDDIPAIAERFRLSAALLPVDGTRVTGEASYVMTPDDATRAAATLRAPLVIPSHAEARFSDPLAARVLASTIEGAPSIFAGAVARSLPRVRCVVPSAGDVVRVDVSTA